MDQPSAPLNLPLLSGEVVWEISDTDFNVVQTGTANPFTTEVPFGDYIVAVHSTMQDDCSQTETSLALDSARNVHAIFAPIAQHQPTAQVFGPAQTLVGSAFPVTWQAEGLHPRDYVTIVPAGAEDGAYADYDRLKNRMDGELHAPAEPGLYEVRLQLDTGGRVLARTPTEVTNGNVSVGGPDRVRAGAEVAVSWTGAIHSRDYIAIVPVGTPDGKQSGYRRIGSAELTTLTAPTEPGSYEIRYHLDRGDQVLARRQLEVLAANAPIDDSAGLVAPATAKPGEVVTVSWSIEAADADRRVTLAGYDAPDFTWIAAHQVDVESETEFQLPNELGQYEARFLDLTSKSVLGRAIITLGD